MPKVVFGNEERDTDSRAMTDTVEPLISPFARRARRCQGQLCGLALLAFVAGPACQSMAASANPEVPTWVHHPSGSIQLDFSRNLLAEARRVGEPYEQGTPALDIEGRRVFVGSRDHGMYAVSAVDGAILWRFETLGPVQGAPLYDASENSLYFGSNDGAVYKLRGKDGTLVWRFNTNSEVLRQPVLRDNTLFVVNANDTYAALDSQSGKLSWSQHRPPALGMSVSGHAGPLVWNGLVYAAYSDGTVTAYDQETGEEAWAPVDLSAAAEQGLGEVPTYLDVDTTPVAGQVEGTAAIFVASYEGGVHALNAATGSRLWSNPRINGTTELVLWSQPAHPARGGGPEVPAQELLIAATGTSGLWALDPTTGDEVWRREVPLGGTSEPVPALGALLFSTTQAGLFLVSPLDGKVIDGIHTGAGFSMAPAVHERRAFILSNAGRLYALQLVPPVVYEPVLY